MKKIEDYVLSIPDFPEPGIIFRDITSVLQDADGLQLAIDSMQDCLKDIDVDVIAGTESRGFIFGVPIAYNLHKPFVPIRKKGKLPRETVSVSYDLEYGSAEIEMHKDSIKPGQKVVIVDDLIATGGTIEAAIKLVEQLGARCLLQVFRRCWLTCLPMCRRRGKRYQGRTMIMSDCTELTHTVWPKVGAWIICPPPM